MGPLNQSLTKAELEERRDLLELVVCSLVNKGYFDTFGLVHTSSAKVEPNRP